MVALDSPALPPMYQPSSLATAYDELAVMASAVKASLLKALDNFTLLSNQIYRLCLTGAGR